MYLDYINGIIAIIFLGIISYLMLLKFNKINYENNCVKFSCFDLLKNDYFWLILMILIYSIRMFRFGIYPAGTNQDGAMGGVDALALATYGTDRFGTHMPVHLYAWGYGQMSSFLSYMQVPFVKLFGLNNFSLRIPALIFSFLGLIAVYILIDKIIGKRGAAIAGLLVAINPWHFMQSRWALDCNMFPHVFLIGLMFLYLGLYKKKYIYVSMVMFGLCMYTYGVSFYFVPLFLIAACVYLLTNKLITVKDVFISIIVYFLVSWPEYMVMIINFMKLETIELPMFTMQFFPDSVRSNDILFFSKNGIGKQFQQNVHSVIRIILMQNKDLPWNDIEGFGTIYKSSWPFLILGVIVSFVRGFSKKSVKDIKIKAGYVLLNMFFVFGIFLGLMINGINVNRSNIVYYINIIMVGVGIEYICSNIKKSSLLIFASYGFLFILFVNTYFGSYKNEINSCFYSDFMNALNYAKEVNADRYLITPDTQFDGAYQTTEILTEYAFEMDAEYYQGITNRFMNVNIPYEDRFRFGNRNQGDDIDEDTMYIIKLRDDVVDELADFSSSEYFVKNFGDKYAVAYKKK